MGNDEPTLLLGCTWGDDLTSTSSLALLAPPGAEGGRITVIGTSSPATTETRALPRG